jgi:hypothetical protein
MKKKQKSQQIAKHSKKTLQIIKIPLVVCWRGVLGLNQRVATRESHRNLLQSVCIRLFLFVKLDCCKTSKLGFRVNVNSIN